MCIKELRDKEQRGIEIEEAISEYHQAEKELNLKYQAYFDELARLKENFNYKQLLTDRQNNGVQLTRDSKIFTKKLVAKLCRYYNSLDNIEQDKLDSDLESAGFEFSSIDDDELSMLDIEFMSPHTFVVYLEQPNSASIQVISFNMPVSKFWDTLKQILPSSFFEEG